MRITYISSKGEAQVVETAPGPSLMEVAVANEVDEIADCDGRCYGGACRIHVAEEWRDRLGPPDEPEAAMIDATEDEHPGTRLSCRIAVSAAIDGIVVHTPPLQIL